MKNVKKEKHMICNKTLTLSMILLCVISMNTVGCEKHANQSVTNNSYPKESNGRDDTERNDIALLFYDVVFAQNNDEYVSALEKIKSLGEDVIPWLEKEMLTNKKDGHWAAIILTEIGTEKAAKALLEGAIKSEMPTVENENITKLTAISGLGDLRHREAIPFLIENIRGEYNAVSRRSAQALAKIDPEIARKEIEDRLLKQDSEWRTHTINARRDFIETLGGVGTKESVKAIDLTLENAKKIKNPSKSQEEALNALFKVIDEAKKKLAGNG